MTQAIKELESQEPMAWMDADGNTFPFVWNVSSLGVQQGSKYLDKTLTPLYAHPPQRTWVDLTRTQMQDVYFEVLKEHRGGHQMEGQLAFGEALQAKIREKNT
jgi:hypothetical protein